MNGRVKPIIEETDVEKLAIAIAKALQQARSVSDSEHYDHHVWMRAKIERENEMKQFWQDMRTHCSKWGAISVLSFIFYGLYLAAQQGLHK